MVIDKNQNYVAGSEETPSDKLLKRYLALFKLAWKEARGALDIANEDMALYNQEINPDTWETFSEITLGDARKMVDQILPVLMMYMFGVDAPFKTIPLDKDVSYETAEKLRKYLLYTMLTTMQLERKGYLTIKTAVQLGSGYGIVEPEMITPPVSVKNEVIGRGVKMSQREMQIGKEQMIHTYHTLPFGSVIPTPDGTCPEDVSCVFVLRQYNEQKFRKMMRQEAYDGPVEEIIERARLKRFNGYLSYPRQVAANIAGYDNTRYNMMNEATDDKTPVVIPVLQCYAPDEHVFFACDKFMIYHAKDKYQTLRNPVIKATFDPEPEQWYSSGIIHPRFNMITSRETFVNSIMDIMTRYLHPHKLTNVSQMVNETDTADYEPYGNTRITGDPNTAISWVFPPSLPQHVFQSGDILETQMNASAGQPANLQGQGTPGLVRGGSGAMESLYERISGREKLSGKHLENGWYQDVIENTLILSQIIGNEEEILQTLGYNKEKEKYEFLTTTVTKEEIRHVYRIELTFLDKMRNVMAEASTRQATYDRMIANEHADRRKALKYLIGNERVAEDIMLEAQPDNNLNVMKQMSGRSGNSEESTLPPGAAGAGIAGGGIAM